MRFLLACLLTASLSFIAGMYLPWWSIAIVALLVALLVKQKIGWAWLAAFTGVFLLWGTLAFIIDLHNQQLLSNKIAQLFSLGANGILLVVLTGFVGGLVAGFAAMAGSSLRK